MRIRAAIVGERPYLYSYTVLFEPAEEGGYVVLCPALPRLLTRRYLRRSQRLKETIQGYLESLLKDGEQLPPDKKLAVEQLRRRSVLLFRKRHEPASACSRRPGSASHFHSTAAISRGEP